MVKLRVSKVLHPATLFAFACCSALTGLASAETVSSERHDFRLVTVADGLEHPWSLAFLPGGDMLVTERAGRLRVIRQGKLDVSGLGGSYGPERLAFYRMLPGMGPPETTIYEYPMEDDSWAVELAELIEDIRLDREPAPGLADALKVLRIVHRIYEVS